jgi:hypothetical protein
VTKHLFDAGSRVFAVSKRDKRIRFEPARHIIDNRFGHLLLSIGKEVMRAALAQAGSPRDF